MSNFIPNKTIKVSPKDAPWISNDLKRMIKRQNRQYKKFKRNGSKPENKAAVDDFRNECFSAINTAKEKYLTDLGSKLKNSETGPKIYWRVLNKLLNKCKIPKIPPLLYNNKFIVNCKNKARLFNDFF